MTTRLIGQQKEQEASLYLQQHGLQLLVENYRSRVGEIDLIMQDKHDLVFIEVRFRQQDRYGDGATSISRSKQIRIIKTAQQYLLERRLYDKIPCRFDVISLAGEGNSQQFDWIKNAFQ